MVRYLFQCGNKIKVQTRNSTIHTASKCYNGEHIYGAILLSCALPMMQLNKTFLGDFSLISGIQMDTKFLTLDNINDYVNL